jgi:hypothetical protein
MNKSWVVIGITFFVLFFATLIIMLSNIKGFETKETAFNDIINQQKATIVSLKSENDSLRSQLNEYGWKTDLLFMCIGIEGDTSEYPTIKIYNKEEREVGKFQYVYTRSDKKIHLGDKFLLVSTPKE